MLAPLVQFMNMEFDPNSERETQSTLQRTLGRVASFATRGNSLIRTVFSVLLIKDFYNTARAVLGSLIDFVNPARIFGEIQAWAQQTKAIKQTAIATRLTTDEVQEYRFVAEAAGLQTDTLTNAVGGLNAKFDSTMGRSKSFSKAIRTLGLDVKALEKQSESVRFDTILGALGKIEERGRRDDLGRLIFGPNFAQMNALLDNSTKNVAKLRALARSSGAVMSKEELQTVERFNFLVKLVSTTWNRFKNIATGKSLKLLSEFLEELITYIDQNRDVLEDFVVFWFDLSIVLRAWLGIMRFGLAALQRLINVVRRFKEDGGLLKLVIVSLATVTLVWATTNQGQLIPSLMALVRNLLPRLIPLLKQAAIATLRLARRAALLALRFTAIATAGVAAFIIIEQLVRFLQGKDNLLSDALGFDRAQSDLKGFAKVFLGTVGVLFGALLFLFGLPVALAGVIVFAWGTVTNTIMDNWQLIKNTGQEVVDTNVAVLNGFVNNSVALFNRFKNWIVGIFDAIGQKIAQTFGKAQQFGKGILDTVNQGAKLIGLDLPDSSSQQALALSPAIGTPGLDAANRASAPRVGNSKIEVNSKSEINATGIQDPKEVAKLVQEKQKEDASDLARKIRDKYDGAPS